MGPTDWRSETFSIERTLSVGAPLSTASSLLQSAGSGMGEEVPLVIIGLLSSGVTVCICISPASLPEFYEGAINRG